MIRRALSVAFIAPAIAGGVLLFSGGAALAAMALVDGPKLHRGEWIPMALDAAFADPDNTDAVR